ncbi:alpha/beta hydrolase [Pararhodonellum marinum]|uniref:alpha/beta hydrolase n=1 Tax=Pararhodonellum marinum TaxID=2755358 RepID=UPI00188E71FF|nr:alpha/beta hydrolase [Pararhodonellum marinum]
MVTHHIITNRNISQKGGKGYVKVNENEYIKIDGDEEANLNLRYGTVTFDPKKTKRLSDFKINIYADPDDETLEKLKEDGKLTDKQALGSTKVFGELYAEGLKAKEREDILVFVHGYRSDLETSLWTLGELHKKYVEPEDSPICHLVLFTWPARRKVLRYRSDAYDAVQSGYAMARSYASLKDFFRQKLVKEKQIMCEQKIHLLCHSMGNRVLEAMLKGLADIQVEINSLFGEIILVGADVDYDALERPKPLYRLIDFGERIHVYYHNKDQALGFSEMTKNAFNRLGRWGAKNSIGIPDDVYQADVSDIADNPTVVQNVVNHWYYYNSPAVVRDIKEVLNGQVSVFTF